MNNKSDLIFGCIKKDENNRIVFFPWGILGNGYVLENDDTVDEIIRFLLRFFIISFLLCIISTFFIRAYSLLLLPGLISIYYLQVRPKINKCPISSTSLTFKEVMQSTAEGYKKSTLYALLFGSVLFAIGCLWMTIDIESTMKERVIGGIGTIFSGIGVVLWIFILKIKRD